MTRCEIVRGRGEAVTARLVCLPHAGGSAACFMPWSRLAPAGLEVCAVRYPGREANYPDAPFSSLEPLVADLAAAIDPLLPQPFALLGHSMGALVAFELARLLRRRGRPSPVHVFVSAHPAPQIAGPVVREAPSDAVLRRLLADLHGAEAALLEHDELVALILPRLRADLAVCATYAYRPEAPLGCPITALGGLDDCHVSETLLAAWRLQTQREFAIRMFPGNHFFLHLEPGTVLQYIASRIGGDAASSNAARRRAAGWGRR